MAAILYWLLCVCLHANKGRCSFPDHFPGHDLYESLHEYILTPNQLQENGFPRPVVGEPGTATILVPEESASRISNNRKLELRFMVWHHRDAIDLIHKSQNAPVPYPTILYSEQKCAHFCSEWSIVGYVTGALWDLWNSCFASRWRHNRKRYPHHWPFVRGMVVFLINYK